MTCNEYWNWRQCVLGDDHDGPHRAADGSERIRLDVWFNFAGPHDADPEYEANTYAERPDDEREWVFIVEWYHDAVGQITREEFDTYQRAATWLTDAGYDDYSSEPMPELPPRVERDIDDEGGA